MKKLYFFDKTKTYIYPNNKLATPDVVAKDFPATQVGVKYVVTSDEDGIIMSGLDMFSTLKSVYQINSSLSDEEALQAIENILNTPETVDETPSAEERIAAALEYQVMSSLPDEQEETIATESSDSTTSK